MGRSTKLFVTCGKEKLYDVMQDVVPALNVYVRDKLDKHVRDNTNYNNRMHFLLNLEANNKKWTNGVRISCYDFDCISINFGIGEMRSLKVYPNFYCDYEDVYEGAKITFDLDCWGLSEEIMMVVAKAVSKYGQVYYDYDDCDDSGFELLTFEDDLL